jgi:hypothetical protein
MTAPGVASPEDENDLFILRNKTELVNEIELLRAEKNEMRYRIHIYIYVCL